MENHRSDHPKPTFRDRGLSFKTPIADVEAAKGGENEVG